MNQFWNLGIKPRFLKIPNHVDENSELRTPRTVVICYVVNKIHAVKMEDCEM